MKIYTKTGDKGKTSLGNGKRIEKNSDIISAIGSVDELNATIGVSINYINDDKIISILKKIQSDLFGIGADIACFEDKRITNDSIEFLEKSIDEYDEKLTELTNFILPGGTMGSSYIHLTRTICRRAERDILAYVSDSKLYQIYINRLSDLLFVIARYLNKGNDEIWKS